MFLYLFMVCFANIQTLLFFLDENKKIIITFETIIKGVAKNNF